MKKKTLSTLMVMALAVAIMIPATGMAIGNSATDRQALEVAKLENLKVSADNMDITFKVAEDESCAELDATVIGLGSEDVDYGMDITEEDGYLVITTFHTGTDIGINRVKLNVFLPKDAMRNLSLDLKDSDLTLDAVDAHIIGGTLTSSKLIGKDSLTTSLDVTAIDSEVNYAGEVGGLDIEAQNTKVDINTTLMPIAATVNGTDSNVTLKVPEEGEGFTLTYSINEGKLSTNFADDYDKENGSIVIGDGEAAFNMTLTNGNLHVNKN